MRHSQEKIFFYLVPGESKFRHCWESLPAYLKRLVFTPQKRLPCGGVHIIYKHCDILNKNGIKAYPVQLNKFHFDWFTPETESISVDEAKYLMRESDVLIVPERIPETAMRFNCKTKIAFVQNWGLADKALGADKKYEDFGFTALLSCSNYNKVFLRDKSSLPCHVVTNGIDLKLFKPMPEKRKAGRILYLKRKEGWEAVKAAFSVFLKNYKSEIDIIELPNNKTQKEMAEKYQESDIFLATGFPEGFALPPLEAMACGCAVAGFSGGGGLEFMSDGENSLVVPDGDVNALCRAVAKLIENKQLKESIRVSGLRKAQEFNLERMESELILFSKFV